MLELDLILTQLARIDFTALFLSIVVGGAVGLEREIHGRPAGVRTHMMVCLSASIAIQASHSLPPGLHDTAAGALTYDPNRLAAGIVTGIGFLGAAVVIRSGDIVRGITTGACVWAVAVLGIAIGQRHYGLALAGAAGMLAVLVAFDWVFSWVTPVIYRRLSVSGRAADLENVTARVTALIREAGVRVQDLAGNVDSARDEFDLVLFIRCRSRLQAPELLAELCGVEGVSSAQWSQIGD